MKSVRALAFRKEGNAAFPRLFLQITSAYDAYFGNLFRSWHHVFNYVPCWQPDHRSSGCFYATGTIFVLAAASILDPENSIGNFKHSKFDFIFFNVESIYIQWLGELFVHLLAPFMSILRVLYETHWIFISTVMTLNYRDCVGKTFNNSENVYSSYMIFSTSIVYCTIYFARIAQIFKHFRQASTILIINHNIQCDYFSFLLYASVAYSYCISIFC